jgi:hypothetical protein
MEKNPINLFKYQENNLSFDFILNRLNLFNIGIEQICIKTQQNGPIILKML